MGVNRIKSSGRTFGNFWPKLSVTLASSFSNLGENKNSCFGWNSPRFDPVWEFGWKLNLKCLNEKKYFGYSTLDRAQAIWSESCGFESRLFSSFCISNNDVQCFESGSFSRIKYLRQQESNPRTFRGRANLCHLCHQPSNPGKCCNYH